MASVTPPKANLDQKLKRCPRPSSAGQSSRATSPSARPFLKWAGGKRQLLPELRRFYPSYFSTYLEPFVGSGAVFFDLVAEGLLCRKRATLIDNNPDLVGCYRALRDEVEDVVATLGELATERQEDPPIHYYAVRDERFNPLRERLLRASPSNGKGYPPHLAAMLLYLNRTGFNGLFRLNSRGRFNVPIGRYSNPTICDAANLRAVSAVLRKKTVSILDGGFDEVLERANKNTFVYLDPPYAPISQTAQFTAYTASGFTSEHQRQLKAVVVELARRGCHVLLSNSTASEIAKLYDGDEEAVAVGLRAYKVAARRRINSKASARGNVLEYLITNIPRRPARAESRG